MAKTSKGTMNKKHMQNKYLALRAKGLDEKTALAMINRVQKSLYYWRKEEAFREAEFEAIANCKIPMSLTEEEFHLQLLETSQLALNQLGIIIQSDSASDSTKLGAAKALLDMLDRTKNTYNETRLVEQHLGLNDRKDVTNATEKIAENIDIDLS